MRAADVERARADTPAVRDLVHLNHAGASLCPEPVLAAVVDHLRLEAAIGGYEAADREADRVEGVYASLARLVGGRPDEVALAEGASRAWHLALDALPLAVGDTVLVSRPEYVANMLGLLRARDRRGVRLEVMADDADGAVDPARVADRLTRGDVAAVALTWVPSQGGLVQPAAAVGAACRDAGVPYLLDACQAVGQLVVDVDALGCDALAATGRKFLRGPRGTGFLWVRSSFLERLDPAPVDGRSTLWTGPDSYRPVPGARRFEGFERPVAATLGLGAAAEYAMALGMAAVEERVVGLGAELRDRLGTVDGVELHDQGRHRCGIVTFTVDGVDAADVAARLRGHRVNVSVSPPELARLDLGGRHLPALVRASVHYLNTTEELDRCAALVAALPRP